VQEPPAAEQSDIASLRKPGKQKVAVDARQNRTISRRRLPNSMLSESVEIAVGLANGNSSQTHQQMGITNQLAKP
jgi:hypothetical protein